MAFGLHSKLLTPREPAGRGSLSGTPLAAHRTSQAIIALAIEAHHFETGDRGRTQPCHETRAARNR